MARPGSTRTTKGAIIGVDIANPLASVIIFQYNPQQLTRTLTPRVAKGNGSDKSEAFRLDGPPAENISLDIKIDAVDQLEQDESVARKLGIYPQLSALEMLLYPKAASVIQNKILAELGTIEIVPNLAPMTLFVWGIKRILPVAIQSFSISEEIHDVNLNPIKAEVKLGLRVLTYDDLNKAHPGFYLSFSHQILKEAMATLSSVNNLANIDRVGVSL